MIYRGVCVRNLWVNIVGRGLAPAVKIVQIRRREVNPRPTVDDEICAVQYGVSVPFILNRRGVY